MPGIFGLTKREQRAVEAAITRPASETELRERPDRVGQYLKKHIDKFLFDQFSDAYIKRASSNKRTGNIDYMKGVPIPLRREDIEQFHSESGLSVLVIAENMAWVIGIDPKFKYADAYIKYMIQNFSQKVDEYLSKEGKDAGEKNEYDDACIHFRASLCVKPYYLDAMYGYARTLRKMYEDSNNSKYVGNVKAEAFEYFELITQIHPKFAHAWYYLGYMYLNMGLYAKAKLAWDEFIKKSKNNKDRSEIKLRIKQIHDPLIVEEGYNSVLSGRWEKGIELLEPYIETSYIDWWPLSYYLGVAYVSTGRTKDAISMFDRVMRLNPTHVETMEELAAIYEGSRNREKAKKYRDKAALVNKGGYRESDNNDSNDGATESILAGKQFADARNIKELPDDTKPRRIKKLEKKKDD